jgi:thiol-disulfide isomerase/thioredoxin
MFNVRRMVIAGLFLGSVSVGVPGGAAAQEARIGIARGGTPEGLTLSDVGGGEVDLADYFGHGPVLLEFWATWCENCEALHPRLLEAHERYGDQVRFFAIAVAVG